MTTRSGRPTTTSPLSRQWYQTRFRCQVYLLQFPGDVGLRPSGTDESVAERPTDLVPRSWLRGCMFYFTEWRN